MRDWSAIVSTRLADLDLDAGREADIRAELAGHLEDEYAAALQRGCSEQDATASALARVPDWVDLARTIHRADRRDGLMSPDTKTIFLPGMTAMCAAATLVVVVVWSFPPSPGTPAPMLRTGMLLLSYLAVGAFGAAWSRRVGGSRTARFLAGIFPLALHLAVILPAIVLSGITEYRVHPAKFEPNLQLGVMFAFVLVPGIALAIGALPFLRSRA